jgi:hypothetical protein
MSMEDPGLDRHVWESELEALRPELEDAPARALPQLADLVERLLLERGFDLDDPVGRSGDEPEIVGQYLAARETADRCEEGEGSDPGDVAAAVEGLLAIFDHLAPERSAL